MAFSVTVFQRSGDVLDARDLINVTDVKNATAIFLPSTPTPIYDLSLSLSINSTGGLDTIQEPEKYIVNVSPSPEQLRAILEMVELSLPEKPEDCPELLREDSRDRLKKLAKLESPLLRTPLIFFLISMENIFLLQHL